jgi:DNA-binding transcriptional LysR family regulator
MSSPRMKTDIQPVLPSDRDKTLHALPEGALQHAQVHRFCLGVAAGRNIVESEAKLHSSAHFVRNAVQWVSDRCGGVLHEPSSGGSPGGFTPRAELFMLAAHRARFELEQQLKIVVSASTVFCTPQLLSLLETFSREIGYPVVLSPWDFAYGHPIGDCRADVCIRGGYPSLDAAAAGRSFSSTVIGPLTRGFFASPKVLKEIGPIDNVHRLESLPLVLPFGAHIQLRSVIEFQGKRVAVSLANARRVPTQEGAIIAAAAGEGICRLPVSIAKSRAPQLQPVLPGAKLLGPQGEMPELYITHAEGRTVPVIADLIARLKGWGSTLTDPH